MKRDFIVALAVALVVTVAVPAALLWDRVPVPPAAVLPAFAQPAAVVAGGPITGRLFGSGLDDPAVDEVTGGERDTPVLIGVVGRLPDAAVALVRDAAGGSRSVAVGAMTDDAPHDPNRAWRLEGLDADSAVFARGVERVRIRLAAD